MPTTYTSRIIEGKINDFQSFALLCTRNFGACMHMSHLPIDEPYFKRKSDGHYLLRIGREKEELRKLEKISDQALLDNAIEIIKSNINYHKERIIEIGKLHAKLEEIRREIDSWVPPGDEYLEIKKFMREQIEITIQKDCDIYYHVHQLSQLDANPEKIDPTKIREERMEFHKASIADFEERHNEDLQKIEDSHQWFVRFLKSIEEHGKTGNNNL